MTTTNLQTDLQSIADAAAMIVDGYAFTPKEDGTLQIINLQRPNHAAIIRRDGVVTETNMDDIELSIATHYWERNKKYLEEDCHAEVL